LDWEAVRCFVAAARAKSLSGGARLLQVEHTTVGRRISSLERALGGELVIRGAAGLALTPLGRSVLRHAKEMERRAAAIGQLSQVARRRVRLVVPTGFTALLGDELEAFSQAQPGLSLEIVSGSRRVDLRKGEADLAIRVGPIEDETLVARKLGDVGSALYGSQSYLARKRQVDLRDLDGHSVIGFHRALRAMPAAQWLEARSARAIVVMRSREAVDMLSAARSGAGLAVLPCFLADGERSLVRLTREPVASRRVSLVYRREAGLSAELRSVISFAVNAARKHAAAMRG
jgi:DNA-binding transcriptional LysR family regulator